jgi:LysM repeat protein
MSGKDSPQSVIDAYRKRQQMTPVFIWGLVVLLVVVGIIILVVWFAVPGKPAISLFASPTPTVTNTFTSTPVTPTATATITPTATLTLTATVTNTATGPFEYTVAEGDTCWDLAAKYKVGVDVLLALNNFGNACPIKPGQKIFIPVEGQTLPTDTPLPTNLAKGVKQEYIVKSGDTLASIANRFGTTVDAIMKENNLKDANVIKFGDKLTITANTVTATPLPTATKTPGPTSATKATSGAGTAAPTKGTTAAPTQGPTATPTATNKPA